MADSTSARQQITDKIKDADTILVTVGKNPSVDELTSALGLTVMLNKLNKHATAVVSGEIPAAIDFLEPGKTFENTVDSLRDFIIALDKEKADHLRYKVEGDVVKIFITPYRTRIDENDLEFTQGDYNVELVLALGVKSQEDLDAALEAHGKILHDATVATISADEPSTLGSIEWTDTNASSISEMLVSLSEAIKNDKPVLDEQSATAFLTGIVATTDRFSNNKTSSKVMTMAAQLMAAGANQQLIAAKLEEAHEISEETKEEPKASSKPNDDNSKSNKKKTATAEEANDGSLAISHEREGDLDKVAHDVARDNQAQAAERAESALANQLEAMGGAGKPSVADLQKDIAAAGDELEAAAPDDDLRPVKDQTMPGYEPTMGGTLNATTEQAAEDKRKEAEKDRNRTILSHSAPIPSGSVPTFTGAPLNAAQQPDLDEMAPGIPPIPQEFDTVPVSQDETPQSIPQPPSEVEQKAADIPPLPPLPPASVDLPPAPTLADLDQQNRTSVHNDAMADVAAAFNQPLVPAPNMQPTADGLPPLPDFSVPPPPPPMPGGSVSTMENNTQAVTDTALPTAQPPEQLGQIFGDTPPPPQTPPAQSNDPAQFKIPGQS